MKSAKIPCLISSIFFLIQFFWVPIAWADRQISSPPISFSNFFRIASTLQNAPGASGYFEKWFNIALKNPSSVAQNGTVTCNIYGALVNGGAAYIINQAGTAGDAVDASGFATKAQNFSIPAGGGTSLNCKIGYYGNTLTAGTMVYANGMFNIEIKVNAANRGNQGWLTGTIKEMSTCNGGCFMTTGGTTSNENLILATEASASSVTLINSGRPF